MLHPLPDELLTELPQQFTYPFCYTPHPLCVRAANEVQVYLAGRKEWQEELAQGKMFGVLVVQTEEKAVGYLAAFSGILAGSNRHPFFVPPVYDMLQPDGFFKVEEANIDRINLRIRELEEDDAFMELKAELTAAESHAQQSLTQAKETMREAKAAREARRHSPTPLTPEETAELIRESQFQKAEYKRLERRLQAELRAIGDKVLTHETEINQLKNERKQRSAALQQAIFERFDMLNARGERRNLCDIFAAHTGQMPPAGAGECAAPKLLQYAYLQGWKPLAMAEFWWGASPATEVRHHGCYYPSCRGKCEPILGHMLQGLDVEEDPHLLQLQRHATDSPEIVYEDDCLLVVNKPAGMLSVPGKVKAVSVSDWAAAHCPEAEGPLIVHRLDMATSGLLVIAKNKRTHCALQTQFKNRTVKKRYIALLDGRPSQQKGIISLPVCLNLMERPRQMVHFTLGKPAVTRYEVLDYREGRTLVALYPHTGRTHQLRLHAAHADGLACPIVGDELYGGSKAERLFLHAEMLELTHPVTGKRMRFEKTADFRF